jgi:hypothetical protein
MGVKILPPANSREPKIKICCEISLFLGSFCLVESISLIKDVSSQYVANMKAK